MSQSEFTLLGDALWLDFVNTARGRTPIPPDLLPDEAAMERWTAAQRLHTNGDSLILLDVLRLRDQLTVLAEALHGGLQPPAGSIAAINEQLARGDGCHQLTRVSGEWQLRFSPVRRPGVLEAIAQSAATEPGRPAALRPPLRRRRLLPLFRRRLPQSEPALVQRGGVRAGDQSRATPRAAALTGTRAASLLPAHPGRAGQPLPAGADRSRVTATRFSSRPTTRFCNAGSACG